MQNIQEKYVSMHDLSKVICPSFNSFNHDFFSSEFQLVWFFGSYMTSGKGFSEIKFMTFHNLFMSFHNLFMKVWNFLIKYCYENVFLKLFYIVPKVLFQYVFLFLFSFHWEKPHYESKGEILVAHRNVTLTFNIVKSHTCPYQLENQPIKRKNNGRVFIMNDIVLFVSFISYNHINPMHNHLSWVRKTNHSCIKI